MAPNHRLLCLISRSSTTSGRILERFHWSEEARLIQPALHKRRLPQNAYFRGAFIGYEAFIRERAS